MGAGQDWVQQMSTQRRASRMVPAMNKDRKEIRRRWIIFSGLTAPLMSIYWSVWAWLLFLDELSMKVVPWEATNSLLPDCHNDPLASPDSRFGSPPPGGVGVRGPSKVRVTPRSSLTHVPTLPVRAHLHTTLPIAPAGKVRWAERHDGKRDLYFQHAA